MDEEQLRGFRQGLKQAGFVEGENVSVLYHSAENEMDRLPALADDLARLTAAHARQAAMLPRHHRMLR
jgi:putative ABC transport system substrate-binding protein